MPIAELEQKTSHLHFADPHEHQFFDMYELFVYVNLILLCKNVPLKRRNLIKVGFVKEKFKNIVFLSSH